MTLTPTDEQACAMDLFASGENVAIQAGAGAGKTSTLKLMGLSTTRRGQYVAFNSAIVRDSARSMPSNIAARTIHSLAFGTVGKKYAHRLQSPRMSSMEIARALRIDHLVVDYGGQKKVMQPGQLAGLTMRALNLFCQSADPVPTDQHIPYVDGIDVPKPDGKRGWANNNALRHHLLPAVRRAWDDAQAVDGKLRYDHSRYLKTWQLNDPVIAADFIMVDEAQDVSGVMLSCIEQQAHRSQIVMVGDSQQNIYSWLGSIDAMSKMPDAYQAVLSQSFRFGPQIAEVANVLLADLDATLRIKGLPSIRSSVGPLGEHERPDAVLCRTNAGAVSRCLEAQAAGIAVHLVGGADDVRRFAEAALDLKAGRGTFHPELAMFDTWGEVAAYVEDDELGGELKLLVELVDKFTPEAIIAGLRNMPPIEEATLVISTAHRSKGLEWGTVQLADDFAGKPGEDPRDLPAEEMRLLYVAVTRAKHRLDVDSVPYFG